MMISNRSHVSRPNRDSKGLWIFGGVTVFTYA